MIMYLGLKQHLDTALIPTPTNPVATTPLSSPPPPMLSEAARGNGSMTQTPLNHNNATPRVTTWTTQQPHVVNGSIYVRTNGSYNNSNSNGQ
jgi:hypothetical protein